MTAVSEGRQAEGSHSPSSFDVTRPHKDPAHQMLFPTNFKTLHMALHIIATQPVHYWGGRDDGLLDTYRDSNIRLGPVNSFKLYDGILGK